MQKQAKDTIDYTADNKRGCYIRRINYRNPYQTGYHPGKKNNGGTTIKQETLLPSPTSSLTSTSGLTQG
jgi:hypothetical protein